MLISIAGPLGLNVVDRLTFSSEERQTTKLMRHPRATIHLLAITPRLVSFHASVKRLLTIALLLIGGSFEPQLSVAAEIYIVKGRDGAITFTSRRPASGSFQTLRSKRPAFSHFIKRRGVWRVRPIKSRYDSMIVHGAERHKLDPHLVKALIHAESGFNAQARSPKGAMGLMQLMPGTAKRFGVSDAAHPEHNVKGGTKYLRLLLDRYSGNEKLALAAYNAGEGAVDPIMDVPPYRETQVYVKRVLKLRELYRCVDSGRTGCPKSAEVD